MNTKVEQTTDELKIRIKYRSVPTHPPLMSFWISEQLCPFSIHLD